ncbi:DUF2147 domain-containing protein [Salinarimonas soli]|uniref:DUF2147 domain-containing protein n=1 Tax=Salinarimonas soli TaxID=1638099 RepID=A0A5B2V8D8_9HYPH|nr:DUF2147 domain-containing protein [Salinarimonas soli]KAA2235314.1 DUF2147 domain-containing protein [Salinarimonas soli]
MRTIAITGLALAFLAGPALAQTADPSGVWQSETGDTRVRIARCGDAYCGTIVAVRGETKDVNNPNEALRSRNLVGARMIEEIRPVQGGGFQGQLYNFRDGKTYTGKMTLKSASAMELSGCVLGGLICRSQTWTKAN